MKEELKGDLTGKKRREIGSVQDFADGMLSDTW